MSQGKVTYVLLLLGGILIIALLLLIFSFVIQREPQRSRWLQLKQHLKILEQKILEILTW